MDKSTFIPKYIKLGFSLTLLVVVVCLILIDNPARAQENQVGSAEYPTTTPTPSHGSIRPTLTATPEPSQTIVMLPALVWCDENTSSAVRQELSNNGKYGKFIITGYSSVGTIRFISVAQISPQKGNDTSLNLEEDATWNGVIALQANIESTGREVISNSAIDGSQKFSELIGGSDLSRNAKDDLAPNTQVLDPLPTVQYISIFPWKKDTKMFYGPAGVHEVGGAFDPRLWAAVDFVGTGDGGDVAPNEFYASVSGAISYICDDGFQMGIKIRRKGWDVEYWLHLARDSRLQVGMEITRGMYLGRLITGTHNTACGYTSQEENHYHVHYGFNNQMGCRFQIEKLCLRYADGNWVDLETSEEYFTGDWITAHWEGWFNNPPSDPSEYDTIWDLVLDGVTGMVEKTAQGLPEHQNMHMAETLTASAGVAISTVYWLVMVNFNMKVPLICLGIAAVSEGARMIYAVWKFIKSAIPLLG